MIESEFGLSENDLDVIGEQIARMWLTSYVISTSNLLEEDDEDIYDDLYEY